MKDAYEIAGTILGTKLSAEGRSRLDNFSGGEVLVMPGRYDQIQDVLDTVNVQYVLGHPTGDALRQARILIVNCPGDGVSGYELQVKDWVAAGGLLLTTDWAIEPLQRMFPALIRWNGKTTRDECIKLDPRTVGKGGLVPSWDMTVPDQPVWWLEGSSYPFTVSDEVDVLLTSEELKRRYDSSLVAVQWNHGLGKVRHMISHIYLQRTESRSDEDKRAFSETLEKYAMDDLVREQMSRKMDLGKVSDGAVASSLTATRELLTFMNTMTVARPGDGDDETETRVDPGPSETRWIT